MYRIAPMKAQPAIAWSPAYLPESPLDDRERIIKRAFDLACASIALIALAPALAIIAAIVWLGEGRPVLLRQKRVGENGRVFEMLKFRTMVRNAEELRYLAEARDKQGNSIYKCRTDPRITRTGRLLRRFSLDELPQFMNVVKGEMSLVGPRPELPHLVAQYKPWQRQRLSVPAGMTGWWQINGRSDRAMHLDTEADMFYVQNYSIWLDLWIIVRTPWAVLIGRGAF